MDTRTSEQRRKIMQSVRSKDTGPEVAVRRLLHKLGYRYRLHRRDLPGTPDIVFPGRSKIILVHGCYWHGHGCAKGQLPKSSVEFWQSKILKNQERDQSITKQLKDLGWKVLVIWQCELKGAALLEEKMTKFLEN